MRHAFPLIRLSVVLGGLLLLLPVHAQYFADVPIGDRDSQRITDAAYHQLMEGFPDGQFRPEAPLRRAENVLIRARLLNMALRGFMVLPGSGTSNVDFPDVPANHWMMPAARFLAEHGALAYPAGTPFGPTATITRGEFLAGLDSLLQQGQEVTPQEAADDFADIFLLPQGWADTLDNPVTRREVACVMDDLILHLTQNAVAEGTILSFETDEQGMRWVKLDTDLGEGRLCLPERGTVVEGGTPADLHAGVKVRTLSDAVANSAGVTYYRVREVTILPANG